MRLIAAIIVLFISYLPASYAQNNADVAKIEAYLNQITSLQAKFAQMGGDGLIQTGTFYLQRPGRLRFEYDPPNADYIVADGLMVNYWDADTKQASNAPIGSTMADFLLRKKISLTQDLQVKQLRRLPQNHVALTLVQKTDPHAGRLELWLREKPWALEKWRVIDGLGNTTEVTLSQLKTGQRLDARLFIFKAPKGFGPKYN